MIDALLNSTVFVLFVIIAIGFIVGRIKVRGINLDVSAVIFVALLFGHYGILIPDSLGTFGMVLFIFSIGIQAGPGFFSTFKSKGRTLAVLGVILVTSAAVISLVVSYIFDFNMAQASGLLTGALTSTPGLATAKEVAGSEAAIAYSIAYPFGVIGVILFVKLLPPLLKIDLRAEERKLKQSNKMEYPEVKSIALEVTNELITKRTLAELSLRNMTGGAILSRIVRGTSAFIPTASDVLELGDRVKAVGPVESLDKLERLIGKKMEGEIPFTNDLVLETTLLTAKELVGKAIISLNMQHNFGCNITRVRRSGVDLVPDPQLKLRFGDKLTIVGPRASMSEVHKLIGNQKKKISDTDFFPIALGVVLGVLLGNISLGFGSFTFSFGLTGGVLLMALLLSSIGNTGSVIWTMSSSANQLLRQLGLLLFLANVGTSAGATLVDTFMQSGWSMFIAGAIITMLPMIITVIIARLFMNVNFLELLGAITGGMTSTPGLAAADSISSSSAVSVAYATVYPVAMVLLIILTQLVAILV